jgi:hypothetical protein
MTRAKFTDTDIRDGLIEISNSAIARCHKPFHKHRRTTKQGLEKIFHDAFDKTVRYDDWRASNQVNRTTFGIKDKFRPKGWVDMVIAHDDGYKVGIEFKVCEFPRMKWTSPNQSTYDVGQIAWDFGALKKYSLNSGYCIVILHGGLVDMPGATGPGIMRSFHNMMFTDYMATKTWGYLKYSKISAPERHEMEIVEEMGFGKPFNIAKANLNNFCRLYRKEKLAVVGISVK